MQLTNAPTSAQFQKICSAVQAERINRYMAVADQDMETAFRYYIWNCALGEAFYTSLHFAEIVCRNAIHSALLDKLGDRWFVNQTFLGILDPRFSRDLAIVVADEVKQHRAELTAHHVVSSLTYGFWEHLTTKRFERILWSKGLHAYFPNAPTDAKLLQLHDLIEAVRRWRNRIAHHRAIFDKAPSAKHNSALTLIRWACLETGVWVGSVSKVPAAIALRAEIAK